MTDAASSASTTRNWPDDLLNRYEYSAFLTNYLERKSGPTQPSIVAALDAPWGLGKTFFVKHWSQDLRSEGRSVLFFNAWENDSADDPAVSFMAELHASLAPIYETLPKADEVKLEIEEKRKQVLRSFRRAVVPVLSIVSKALLKKATGVAVNELSDAILSETEAGSTPKIDNGDDTEKTSMAILDKSLDAIFEKTMETHSQRLKSIAMFRTQLEELIEKLHEHGVAKGPMWVFIDELDRCRPDYAISLLEGIKHLFSVKGVLFVVSTNLEQLSKAVGAVYGANFDGYQYLKRFFTLEYTLPEPTRFDFLASQTKGTLLEAIEGCTGLDLYLHNNNNNPILGMSYVAEAMRLDLRSIQQITGVVEAAVLGMPKNSPVASMWLFFLAAVRHLRPDIFRMFSETPIQSKTFSIACDALLIGSKTVPARDIDNGSPVEIQLQDVLATFFNASSLNNSELSKTINRYNRTPPYPDNLYIQLMDFGNTKSSHSIRNYPKLLNLAGHIAV